MPLMIENSADPDEMQLFCSSHMSHPQGARNKWIGKSVLYLPEAFPVISYREKHSASDLIPILALIVLIT